MRKRLHNHIAESILTIYLCSFYGPITWITNGLVSRQLWLQFILMAITNCILIAMNKQFVLLRTRSWMITSVFILLSACCGFTYASMDAGVVGICAVTGLFFLFLTYQSPGDAGNTYFAYLTVGIASLFFVQSLYSVPLLWLFTPLFLQSMNLHTWLASLLGLLTPYWFLFPWYLYHLDYETMFTHFLPLFHWQSPEADFSLMPVQIVMFILIAVLAIIGAFNFWSRSYEERIRTRQFYSFLQWLGLAVASFIILQPQHFNVLIRVVLVCASPFIAHFFTFNPTKLASYLFYVTAVLVFTFSIICTNESLMDHVNSYLLQIWNA